MTTHRIICGDSKDVLDTLAEGSAHLIITSPPYGNFRDYSDNPADLGNMDIHTQVSALLEIIAKSKRVLAPGRKLCLNHMDVPIVKEDGAELIAIQTLLVPPILEMGFTLRHVIYWVKACVPSLWHIHTGTMPYPPSPIITSGIEYILVFRDKRKQSLEHISPEAKEASRVSIKGEWAKWATGVWPLGSPPERKKYHPAPFHEEIPRRLIKLFSFVGETILDPFCGTGTVNLQAKLLARNSVGIDINPKYAATAESLLRQDVIEIPRVDVPLSDKLDFFPETLDKGA